MTDREALLASILASPGDDLPRLVFADWLDENGESERASFIRCQIELARRRNLMCGRCEKFLDRYAMTTPHCRGDVCSLRRREYESSKRHIVWDWIDRASLPSTPFFSPDDWRRGFPASLTCDWSRFLEVERSLLWSPTMTDECPECKGSGWRWRKAEVGDMEWPCRTCPAAYPADTSPGTGRVPRPFVATAQPILNVRLTTDPAGLGISHSGSEGFGVMSSIGQVHFTSVTCPTCDVSLRCPRCGFAPYRFHPDRDAECVCDVPCPQCHGELPNSWRCPTWPGITFQMPPAAEYRDYATADFTLLLGDMARAVAPAMAALGETFRDIGNAARVAGQTVLAAWPRDGELVLPDQPSS